MKINVAYVRCSTDNQDVQHQLNSINMYASANNIPVDTVIKDEGISAFKTKSTERKGLTKLLKLADENKIENLIVFESSRLSRNFEDGINIINRLTTCGVKVYSVQDNACINQSDYDKLMNSFRYFINEKASKESSARIKSSKKLSKEQGLYLGGPILYGFKVEDKKLVVDETKIEIIKELYRIYLSKSCSDALEYISMYTDRYTGNNTLLQYMSNPQMERIVGPVMYKHFMESKSKRRTSNGEIKTNRTDIMLEGLLYHACGNKLTIDYDRKGRLIFRCRHCKAKKINDYKKSYTGQRLMDNIEDRVVSELDNLDKDKLLAKYRERTNTRVNIIEDRIKRLESDYKTKNKDLNKANNNLKSILTISEDLSMIKVVTDTVNMMKKEISDIEKELESCKADLKGELIKDNNNEIIVDKLMNTKYLFSKGTKLQKKIIMNQIVNKIIVRDIDDFTIYFNF